MWPDNGGDGICNTLKNGLILSEIKLYDSGVSSRWWPCSYLLGEPLGKDTTLKHS